IEGTMIFADVYPEAPAAEGFVLRGDTPSKWTPSDLYSGIMFHGPLFKAVSSISRSGEDGIEGTLKVLATDGFFRSKANARFVTDPVLLDAVGQLVGFWAAERLHVGFHVFPFRVEGVRFYGPNLAADDLVQCRICVGLEGESQLRSDMDVVSADDRLLLKVIGWWDTRFDLPDPFFRLRVSPRDCFVGIPWSAPVERFPSSSGFQCCVVKDISTQFLEGHGAIWQQVLACLLLSRRERETWRTLNNERKHRSEWLLGRATLKDAVRLSLLSHGISA